MNRNILILTNLSLIFILFLIVSCSSYKKKSAELPRVIVTTDINNVGGDPDDKQSLAHLLIYANEVEIRAIIPDYWNGKGVEAAKQTLLEYEQDFNNPNYTFKSSNYPSPNSLREKIVLNKKDAVKRIIEEANKNDKRPLYVLVWGSMNTIQQALFDEPTIVEKLRILTIATNIKAPTTKGTSSVSDCDNSNWNGKGRDTIFNDNRFNKLWWIENDWSYNGMFIGEAPKNFLLEVKNFGKLGYYIWQVVQSHDWAHYFRAGDTPTLLYLLEPVNHNNPAESSWGGKFIKPFPKERPNYWIDFAGTNKWNYKNPCKTWLLADSVYKFRINNLIKNREEMYNAFRLKLKKLYKNETQRGSTISY